jgi:hypothetical protein
MNAALQNVLAGERLADSDALALADFTNTRALADVASVLRDQGFRNTVTYSRKGLYSSDPPVSGCLSLLHLRSGTAQGYGART